MRDGQRFDKKVFDLCDTEGKRLLAELCEQRGVIIIGNGDFWKYGDVPIDLGNGKFEFGEAEMRGVTSKSPWVADTIPGHPWKFGWIGDGVSVIGRKAEDSHALFQASFDGPNATIALMEDAHNKRYWIDIETNRGEDFAARLPVHLCALLHLDSSGNWVGCPHCNPAEEISPSQQKIMEILHFPVLV